MEEDLNKNSEEELKKILEKHLSEFNEELDKKLDEKFNKFLPKEDKIPELPEALQDKDYEKFKNEIKSEEFKEFLAKISNNKYKDIFDIKSIEEVDGIVDGIIENNKDINPINKINQDYHLNLIKYYRAYYLNRENFLKHLEQHNKKEKFEAVLYNKEIFSELSRIIKEQYQKKYKNILQIILQIENISEFNEVKKTFKKNAKFLEMNSGQNYNISTLLNCYENYLNKIEKKRNSVWL